MKTPDFNINTRPTVDGLSKERLLLNPFSGILSEEEFRKSVLDGITYFDRYLSELNEMAQEQSRKDNIYELYSTRLLQKEFSHSFTEGKVTEDFSETILLEDPITTTTSKNKLEAMREVFKDIGVASFDYDEYVSKEDLFDLYKDDPSGKLVVESIAREKVRNAVLRARKEKQDISKDFIGTDVGVFVPDDSLEPIFSDKESEEAVKPTHIWLQKPSTKEEMSEMLREMSGKKIDIFVSITIGYRVLIDGPDTYRSKNIEVPVSVRTLLEEEINTFVEKYFEKGQHIASGVDFTSYGAELIVDGEPLPYNSVVTPVAEMKKLWAEVQIIKRAAHLHSLDISISKKAS